MTIKVRIVQAQRLSHLTSALDEWFQEGFGFSDAKNLNGLCRSKFAKFFHLLVVRRYRVHISKNVKMEKNEEEENDEV